MNFNTIFQSNIMYIINLVSFRIKRQVIVHDFRKIDLEVLACISLFDKVLRVEK